MPHDYINLLAWGQLHHFKVYFKNVINEYKKLTKIRLPTIISSPCCTLPFASRDRLPIQMGTDISAIGILKRFIMI